MGDSIDSSCSVCNSGVRRRRLAKGGGGNPTHAPTKAAVKCVADADCESGVCINRPPVAYPKRADGKVGQGEVVCRDGDWVTEETQMQSGFVTATADFYENPKNVKWGFSIHNRPMCATHPASARGSHSRQGNPTMKPSPSPKIGRAHV